MKKMFNKSVAFLLAALIVVNVVGFTAAAESFNSAEGYSEEQETSGGNPGYSEPECNESSGSTGENEPEPGSSSEESSTKEDDNTGSEVNADAESETEIDDPQGDASSSEADTPDTGDVGDDNRDGVPSAFNESGTEVTPGENDFDFSGGVLNGLKKSYMDSLSADQKKNIRLVIPKAVGGVSVTSINSRAFYNTGCEFITLDLTNALELTAIGDHAFDGVKSLTGGLVIPDKVTSVGSYAFTHCGFTGSLTLPAGLKSIGNYAFSYCGFTGGLELPDGLTTLGDSAFRLSDRAVAFTGSIKIPAGISEVANCAFLNQGGITSVEFTSQESIVTSAFRYTGISGVLKIPDSIKSIGSNAFGGTNITTVYLPENEASKGAGYVQSNSFGGCTSLKAIVCSRSNFNNLYGSLQSSEKAKLGFPITVTFNDGKGGSYEPIDRLFNQPLNLLKSADDNWVTDSSYKLPEVLNSTGAENKKWAFSTDEIKGITETSKVTSTSKTILYAVTVPVDPVITYSGGIDKVYDGEPGTLSVTATHPLYKNIEDAGEDDVVFYYTWTWATINPPEVEAEGFDVNTYEVTDVREPRFGIICTVKTQACIVKNNVAKPFFTESYDFPVHLRQAESAVNPVYPNGLIKLSDGFPSIGLSAGDTPGTIKWDEGQVLEAGEHEYPWTFTPESNAAGSSNYKEVKGTVTLNAFDGEIFNMSVTTEGNGKVTPEGSFQLGQGQNVDLVFEPEFGYILSGLTVDGKECTVKNNQYTVADVQKNCTIHAVFSPVKIDDVKDMISNLPVIDEGEDITGEQAESILDAKLNMEALSEGAKEEITPEETAALCDALSKHPQVSSAAIGLDLENKNLLLDNMTADDIQMLKADPANTYALAVKTEKTVPNSHEEALIGQVLGEGRLAAYLNIKVEKTVTAGGTTETVELSKLQKPLKLILQVPQELADENRTFFAVRLHSDGAGTSAEVLEDEDSDAATVTISSDKFSVYGMAYRDNVKSYDIIAEAGSNGKIDPVGTISVPEGGSRTFTFTPDSGYEVDSVLLDGADVGASASYTINDITSAHSIKVLFKKTVQLFSAVFDSNGGSDVESVFNIAGNSRLTKPADPHNDGYTFTGWYKDAGCTVLWDFENDLVTGDITLYAGWKTAAANSPEPSPDPTAKPTPEPTAEPSASPSAVPNNAKTGDSNQNPAAWLILIAAVSCMGLIIPLKKITQKDK